jgi:hypothetical protein
LLEDHVAYPKQFIHKYKFEFVVLGAGLGMVATAVFPIILEHKIKNVLSLSDDFHDSTLY